MPIRLGWLVDPFDHRDHRSTDLVGATTRLGALPRVLATASMKHLRGPRIFQVGQSCVGFSLERAIYLCHRLQGISSPALASGLHIYTAARSQETIGVTPPPRLEDRGCYPRLALRAIHDGGFLRREDWPERYSAINKRITPMATRAAFDQRGDRFAWFRIEEVGIERVRATRLALQAGWSVIRGIWVDKSYLEHRSSDPITSIDPNEIVGGHMQTVLEVLDDDTVVEDNWWEDWGFEDGFGRLSPGLYGSGYVSDVYAIKSVPPYSG
jgi:hypothetical protein